MNIVPEAELNANNRDPAAEGRSLRLQNGSTVGSNGDGAADAAEKALIASILRAGRIPESVSTFRVYHFRVFAHQVIFEAILDLCSSGQIIGPITVANLLEQRKRIDHRRKCPEVSYDYLAELVQLPDIVPAEGIFEYGQIVRENSDRRRLLQVANEIVSIARSRGPVGELREQIKQELGCLEESPGSAGSNGLVEVDASELASSTETYHLDYLPFLGQDGYVVKGWSHLVAGYPRAGKTELIAACCQDWLSIGERILYFTEEPRSIWQLRLAKRPDAWAGMRLVFALGADPLAMKTRMQLGHENVVIFDSIRNLGLVGEDEKDNTALAAAMVPWVITARQKNKTLIMLHHDRKGGGQHGEAIAGGHALLATFDIGLELVFDSCPHRRLIRAYARILQPPELMYERQDDGTMHALGSPDNVSLSEVRRRVTEVLEAESEWLKTSEIRDRLEDPKPGIKTVRDALVAEARAGKIERDPPLSEENVERMTHRWRKAGWA